MKRSFIGLGILGVVAATSAAVTLFDFDELLQSSSQPPIDVSIYFGGEKTALLANPKVADIIENRYNVNLTATRAGSIEMVTSLPASGRDCLWPSNAVAVDLARSSGRTVLGDETIFNSPIVFFAWSEISDALVTKGVVRQNNDVTLTADVGALSALIEDGASWQDDLGVNVYGSFRILSTDPARSNSGNIWAALLATSLNGGITPVDDDLNQLLPKIESYFDRMGYMEASSGDIFENFLKQGIGSRPIIVGYENQLVEFLIANDQYADLINDRIRVIYPEPTIFASHPIISLTPACGRLAEALADPDIQQIAWTDHGFRTGLIGVQNDPDEITQASMPDTISLVAPMPSASVMQKLIDAVEN